MADLLQSARLFEVGTRLQTASSCLAQLGSNAPLSSGQREALKWAGRFLTEVDWKSGINERKGVDGGLAVSAANARPKFYASLIRIGPKFQGLGIDSERKVYAFLKKLYTVMLSGGTGGNLGESQLGLASELLHVLSKSIVVELSNNGLPKRQPVLSL
jgi:hypothetical protein